MKKRFLTIMLLMAVFAPLAMQAQGLMKAPRGTALQAVSVQSKQIAKEMPQTREAGWLQYDNGTHVGDYGLSTAYVWEFGPLYPASMLGNNNTLSKVSFWENSAMIADYGVTVNVYQPDTTTLLYQEEFELNGSDGMHEVEFSDPVTIDPTQDLWITITVAGTYVFAVCECTEANNDWVDWAGWRHGSEVGLTGLGWMIRGYVEYIDPASCLRPTQLAASDITLNTATLSWSGEARSYQVVYSDREGFDPDSATPIEVTETSYTLTNLSDGTTYYAYVRANCGDSYSPWSSMATFTTISACATPYNVAVSDIAQHSTNITWNGWQDSYTLRYTAPAFFDDFENGLDNWTIITAGEAPQDNGWYPINPTSSLNIDAHSGSYAASAWSWSSSAYDANNWLITPEVELGGALSFWVYTNSGYPDSYEVLLATEGNDTTNFTTVLQAMAPAPTTGEWSEVSIDLSAYSGTGYIAIHHVDYDANYILVDDFLVEAANATWTTVNDVTSPYALTGLTEDTQYLFQIQGTCPSGTTEWSDIANFTTLPLCLVPSDLNASDITTTSAVITWTSEARSFDIEIDGEVTEGLTEASLSLNNLNPGTLYAVRVRANCGETGYSEWTNYYYFATLCNAYDLPYEYGFEDVENNNTDLNCWWYASANSENGIGVMEYEDNHVFTFSSYYQASSYAQMLMSPELNAETAVTVEFDYMPLSTQYGNESFMVGYSADGDNFTWGEVIEADTTIWAHYSETFPDSTKYVAIYYTSEYLTYLLLDNFSFTEASTTVQQTVNLAVGTNWFSTYVDITLAQLEEAIVAGMTDATNTTIKAKDGRSTTYNGSKWRGNLTSLDVAQMYKINAPAACEISLEGTPINPADHPVTVPANASSWIGIPISQSITVTNAFTGFAQSGDQIKAKDGKSTTYNGSKWRGTLTNLEPGQGYVYTSAYAEDRVLIFPTGTSKAAQADVKPLGFFGNKQIAKTAMPLELNKDGKAESAKRIRK